jgi:hypothetical protein
MAVVSADGVVHGRSARQNCCKTQAVKKRPM